MERGNATMTNDFILLNFAALGFQQFLNQDSELTLEMVEEGKEHIKREKRRIQRLQESASRRRDFRERFADPETGTGGTDRRGNLV